jgi:hypothetical protein
VSAAAATVLGNDPDLLARVLDCYKPQCRYLKSMVVSTDNGVLRGEGVLEIPESCYIDDTGHLNSVEVNICYNQLLYQALATAVRDGIGPVFDTWTMEDFWRRRLPDILITRFSSVFRRPIDPRSFRGEFVVDSVRQRRLRPDADPLVSLETSFRCRDEAGGVCSGTAQVTIVGS